MRSSNQDQKKWARQWVGVLAGGAIGWLLTTIFPVLSQRFNLVTVVLWCAVIGGILTSLDGFIRAGAALTRRENRWLNLSVGLGIPILILILITLIFR